MRPTAESRPDPPAEDEIQVTQLPGTPKSRHTLIKVLDYFRANRRFSRSEPKRAVARHLPDNSDNRLEDLTQVTKVPDAPKYRDPLIGVLDYITEKCPEDIIAITHDDDLRLVENVETLSVDSVGQFLREKQLPVLIEDGVAFLRGQQGDIPPVCDDSDPNAFFVTAELGGKQAPAVSSSEPDTATHVSTPSSSVSREPTHDTSLRIIETIALPLSQALPSFAANESLTSQPQDTVTATALEPPQPVVLASSSSHNEGILVSLSLQQLAKNINVDVHPHPGPVAPSLQDDVRLPRLWSHFPLHCSYTHDQFRLLSTKSYVKRPSRARFNPDPVTEVRSIPSPASSTSSLSPSPGPSTPPPLHAAFPPANSSSSLSSPSSQAHALPHIPPPPFTCGVCIHPAIALPNLQYDVRFAPTQSNPHLSPAILAQPASSPPLPTLVLCVDDLPWPFNAKTNAGLSSGNAYVTVQDVLLAIHHYFRTAVKKAEYEAMSRSRKVEIFREFERRVNSDPIQRGKGLRRIDFLNGRFRAQGLVGHSMNSVWKVIVH